jgi:hypothetical protein
MSTFAAINTAATAFNESVMGETFSYTAPGGGTPLAGLRGVVNTAAAVYMMEDIGTRQTIDVVVVSGKAQWGAVVPANRGTVMYGAIAYVIETIDGANTGGEPCYTLGLKRLT